MKEYIGNGLLDPDVMSYSYKEQKADFYRLGKIREWYEAFVLATSIYVHFLIIFIVSFLIASMLNLFRSIWLYDWNWLFYVHPIESIAIDLLALLIVFVYLLGTILLETFIFFLPAVILTPICFKYRHKVQIFCRKHWYLFPLQNALKTKIYLTKLEKNHYVFFVAQAFSFSYEATGEFADNLESIVYSKIRKNIKRLKKLKKIGLKTRIWRAIGCDLRRYDLWFSSPPQNGYFWAEVF
jgi:hypothetical protein